MLRLSVFRIVVAALILFHPLADSQNISCYLSNKLLYTTVASPPRTAFHLASSLQLFEIFCCVLPLRCVALPSRLPSQIFDFYAVLSQIFCFFFVLI